MTDLTQFYIKAEDVLKQTYSMAQVEINKRVLLESELGKEVYNYILDLLPQNSTIALLLKVDYDSIIRDYLTVKGYTESTYNDIMGTICKGIMSHLVSDHASKLNRKQAINSIIYLLILA